VLQAPTAGSRHALLLGLGPAHGRLWAQHPQGSTDMRIADSCSAKALQLRPRSSPPKGSGDPWSPADTWPSSGSLSGEASSSKHSGPDSAGSSTVAERQEELLRHLAEFTRCRPNERGLTPDFRLQLQLLECSIQQQRLLQQVTDQQRRAAANLESLQCRGTKSEELVQKRFEQVLQRLDQLNGGLSQCSTPEPAHRCCCEATASELSGHLAADSAASGVRLEAVTLPVYHPSEDRSVNSSSRKHSKPTFKSQETGLREHIAEGISRLTSRKDTTSLKARDAAAKKRFVLERSHSSVSTSDYPILHWMINHWVCDMVCSFVIALNAATIGISLNDAIAWQMAHVGEAEKAVSDEIRFMGYFFITFYTIELSVKLCVYGKRFFRNENWLWNSFDCLLVMVGIYDLIMDILSNWHGKEINVTWMRLLRLFRMLKMLRVVRIMRFFRVLRMMVNSIAGSITTLMWSILMLALMMYIFGLTFLQIMSGYLSETQSVHEETLASIEMYWGSVFQSMITLYWSVTGGADWEQLAQPVRRAGAPAYALFLFYIAFTAFAVLNVLTGLYVETATKISQEDDEHVGYELYQRPETAKFVEFFQSTPQEDFDSGEYISLSSIQDNMSNEIVKAFLAVAELTPSDVRHIFKTLDTEKKGVVLLAELLDGCFHAKSTSVNLGLLALTSETKRCVQQQNALRELLEDRFARINSALGLTKGAV